MYRDILVHVDGHAAAQKRLGFSIDLASRIGAKLTGLHVRPPLDVEPVPLSLLDEALQRRATTLATEAHAAADAFNDVASQHTGATWRDIDGDIVDGICRCAAFADLVILGQYEWQRPINKHPLPIAHAVIQRSGRPVLVVPAEQDCRPPQRIIIGWNGTREVVRAVHDAMPFLISADSIDIIVDGPTGYDSGSALAHHLANHGCPSQPKVMSFSSGARRAVSNLIFSGDHDLLIMGGSPNATWREVIFGGLTRSFIMESTIPVLAAI